MGMFVGLGPWGGPSVDIDKIILRSMRKVLGNSPLRLTSCIGTVALFALVYCYALVFKYF